ncbi:MAG: ATP-binding protein [Acidobacteriaceae bacterium]
MGNDISGKTLEEQTPVEQDFLGGEIGTGLGLWVSAGIVEKHRGSVHVRSRVQPGKSGTTFTVILPYSGPRVRDTDAARWSDRWSEWSHENKTKSPIPCTLVFCAITLFSI